MEHNEQKTMNSSANAEFDSKEKGEKMHNMVTNEFLSYLMQNSTLFKDTSKQTYILFDTDGQNKLFIIGSKDFRAFLSSLYLSKYKNPLSPGERKMIIDLFDHLAYSDGESIHVDNRCVWDNDVILYDLHNDQHDVVCINASGWEVIKCRKPLFKDYQHQLTQVLPTRDGSIDEFIDLLNVATSDRRLIKAYIIAIFIPGIPHPLLKIEGEKGSAKSTAVKLLKMLIDPSVLQTLSFPKDTREMVQQLDHHYFIGYDNVSKIPRWASDTLCRAVSGDGYSSRRLYTSDEDTIRSFIRCVSINGLNLGALQDDLLDRSLIINFKRISQENRKTEGEIWSRFQEILPSTLGSIFHIVSEAMKIYPTIKLNGNYRLADFIKWSCAITAAIEGECGVQNFINDYQRMVNQQEAASIDDNVLLTSLQHFFNRFDSWSGTPTQLYNLLSTIAAFHKLDVKHESWPKAPNYLSKALRAYQALLKDTGYVIDQTQRSSTERIIRLSKKERPNDAEPMEVITKDNVTESITIK